MKDEDFDLLIKRQIQKNTYIPEKINHLFANFENEVNMNKNKKNKIGYNLRKGVIAASSILVMFLGSCTYAHINGTETIISPLLRNLGINSKYEENATKFDEETTKQDITVKMLDGAMDDTTFIVGYEIGIPDINLDKWIEMEGNYKINNVNITPINTSISKTEDGKFLYYQVFDMNELKIKGIYKHFKGDYYIVEDIAIHSETKEELYKKIENLKKEIINNLLTNAFKFTDKGTITLTINSVIENNICNLQIEVKDTGIGIKSEDLNKIFSKKGIDNDINSDVDRDGIGLLVSKDLIYLMNGTINVRSYYGSGSVFSIEIPQKISNIVDNNSNDNNITYDNKTILLVDDDELIYDRGVYKGQDKRAVALRQAVPVLRQINKFNNLGATMSYYNMYNPFGITFTGFRDMISPKDSDNYEDE